MEPLKLAFDGLLGKPFEVVTAHPPPTLVVDGRGHCRVLSHPLRVDVERHAAASEAGDDVVPLAVVEGTGLVIVVFVPVTVLPDMTPNDSWPFRLM